MHTQIHFTAMKTTLLLSLAFTAAISLQAQEAPADHSAHKSLFKGATPTYGILDLAYNQASVAETAMPGFAVTGGAVFRDFWMVGVHADFAVTSRLSMGEPPVAVVNPRYTTYFVALHNEFLLFPHSAVNVSFPVRVGLAGVSYVDRYYQGQNTNAQIDQESFFMAEPGAKINFNLWPHLGITAGAGYRIAAGVDRAGSDSDFTAPVFHVGMRVKLFDE